MIFRRAGTPADGPRMTGTTGPQAVRRPVGPARTLSAMSVHSWTQ
jgi:hypothetical protein